MSFGKWAEWRRRALEHPCIRCQRRASSPTNRPIGSLSACHAASRVGPLLEGGGEKVPRYTIQSLHEWPELWECARWVTERYSVHVCVLPAGPVHFLFSPAPRELAHSSEKGVPPSGQVQNCTHSGCGLLELVELSPFLWCQCQAGSAGTPFIY